jgi:hypothetical protein
VQSRKVKPEPNITEAAEKTGLLIRGLQSRLLEGTGEIEEPPGETAANLEKELQEYFACWPGEQNPANGPLTRIRLRVIQGVAERILGGWQQDEVTHPFENEVIARLIDRVFEMMIANGSAPGRVAASFPAGANPATPQLSSNQIPA